MQISSGLGGGGCLFVCLFGLYRITRDFSLIWRRHHYRWRVSNFYLSSALMAIEQWGFFSVLHLLWHGSSAYKVYNGHLRRPVTLTPIAERLAVELSLPVFTTYVCRGWDWNTQRSNPLRLRRGWGGGVVMLKSIQDGFSNLKTTDARQYVKEKCVKMK